MSCLRRSTSDSEELKIAKIPHIIIPQIKVDYVLVQFDLDLQSAMLIGRYNSLRTEDSALWKLEVGNLVQTHRKVPTKTSGMDDAMRALHHSLWLALIFYENHE